MNRNDNQDDPKFDRKTKALRKVERRHDEEREAELEMQRVMRNPNAWRQALDY